MTDWGYCDSDGKLVSTKTYEYCSTYTENKVEVRQNSNRLIIDLAEEVLAVLPFKVTFYHFHGGIAMLSEKDGDRWLVNKSFERQCDLSHFTLVGWPFDSGLCHVRCGGKYGFIDTEGELRIECKFDTASAFSEGFAVVKIGPSFWLIDCEGNQRFGPYRFAFSPINGIAIVATMYESGLLHIDESREVWIPFANGILYLRSQVFACGVGDQYEIVNCHGEKLGLLVDDISPFVDGVAPAKIGNSWGLINTLGEWVLNPIYESLTMFNEGLAIGVKERESFGIVPSGESIWTSPRRLLEPPSCGRIRSKLF